jgi:hypothetical protein
VLAIAGTTTSNTAWTIRKMSDFCQLDKNLWQNDCNLKQNDYLCSRIDCEDAHARQKNKLRVIAEIKN